MIFEMDSCGGCCTCEMACSFKHKQEFMPSASSIQILEKRDGIGFYISFAEENEKKRIICDGCIEMEEPLCVQHCKKAEDLKEILKNYIKCKEKQRI